MHLHRAQFEPLEGSARFERQRQYLETWVRVSLIAQAAVSGGAPAAVNGRTKYV